MTTRMAGKLPPGSRVDRDAQDLSMLPGFLSPRQPGYGRYPVPPLHLPNADPVVAVHEVALKSVIHARIILATAAFRVAGSAFRHTAPVGMSLDCATALVL